MGWTNQLWNLLRRRQFDSELEEELRFHLDARMRDNIKAGMTPREARQDAVRRFGSQALSKEMIREADMFPWMDTLKQDLSYAFRSLGKNPGFAAIAILVLALGIGANTAVFTVMNGVLLRPLPFPEPDRLFLISYVPKQSPFFFGPGMADYHYLEFRQQDRQFESVASFGRYPATLTREGDPVRLSAASVTPHFLQVLRVDPVAGRDFLPEEGQEGRNRVVLIGDKLWHSRFGGAPEVLGKTITLDGIGHTVIGIMPPGFAFPSGADLWTPMEIRTQPGSSFRRPVIGRLKAGVSPQQAQSAWETFAAALPLGFGGNRDEFAARVTPLKDVIVADIEKSLLIFVGAVVFVLLITCANVANLLLIRAASRRQEITVRAALGASRWRLIRQLLTESVLVSLAGGAAGMLLAAAAVPALLALAPEGSVPRVDQVRLDATAVLFTLGLSTLTGIAFGLVPAFQSTRRDLRESLAESARTLAGGHERLRGALVVSEIALALVLLTGAGLLLKSFVRLHTVDPGFQPENVLAITVEMPESKYTTPAQLHAFHEHTLAGLTALPGVASAGAVNWLPLGPLLMRGGFQLEGGSELPAGYSVDKPVISPGYFPAMGIRLLSGREFTERDNQTAPKVAIVSESVARTVWPGENAVGKRISMANRPGPGDWITIVGIAGDVRQGGLTTAPSPALYVPYLQVDRPFFLSHMTFVVRAASGPAAVARGIRGVVQGVDPDQPVETITTMESVIAGTTAEPRFRTQLLLVFSAMAVLLAAIGIYGVLACSITERRQEIGIRMALGADTGNVVRMVLRRTLLLAAVGVALGMAGALAVTRVLENFLFEVEPTDPWTFAMAAALLIVIALLAGSIPARRASTVDPLVALRYE